MKKVSLRGIFVCLAAAAILIGGCGQETETASLNQGDSAQENTAQENNADTESVTGKEKEETAEVKAAGEGTSMSEDGKTAEDIYEEITRKIELCSPVTMTDSFITNYYGIDPNKLEEYVFSMSEDATSAETIIIMKVKDEDDAQDISAALEVVREEKSGEMKDYLPAQFEIVDQSSVKTEGKYVYLVISEEADAISRIIEENK